MSAQKFANSQVYALVKKRTRHGELKNMTLCCNRDGIYNKTSGLTEETYQRYRNTKLIDCLFELYVSKHNGIWYLEVCNAWLLRKHPIACQLTKQQLETVVAMTH